MQGWKRKLWTLVLYVVAAILITWAIWIGPAPRSDEAPGANTARPPNQPQRTSATPQT